MVHHLVVSSLKTLFDRQGATSSSSQPVRVLRADRKRNCDVGRHAKGAGAMDTNGGAGARENEARWGSSSHVRQEAYRRRLLEGYDTVQGLAELDAEGLVDAGM